MLDVHPPEHPAHSWQDFFIHIATICIGLLIAISLEQAVEALHHHHQRRELEENVRVEAEHNIQTLGHHVPLQTANIAWWSASLKTVQDAAPSAGAYDIVLPSEQEIPGILVAPSRFVWPVAQAAGTVILLPEGEAETYARLDYEAQSDEQVTEAARAVSADVVRFQDRIHARLVPNARLHLTPPQRDELIVLTSDEQQAISSLLNRDLHYIAACQAIADGVTTVDGMNEYLARQARPFN